MKDLLSGVSMTLSGIVPSRERARALADQLSRVAERPSCDKLLAVLNAYADGAAVERARLLEASMQWRELVPQLRGAAQPSMS